MWYNANDADLHVVVPNGEEIYYGHRNSTCGGCLDVDMNAGGCTSDTPVENIYWKTSKPAHGHYRIFARNFSYKCSERAFPFKVRVLIGSQSKIFEGTLRSAGSESDVTVLEFDYEGPDKNYFKADEVKDPPLSAPMSMQIHQDRLYTVSNYLVATDVSADAIKSAAENGVKAPAKNVKLAAAPAAIQVDDGPAAQVADDEDISGKIRVVCIKQGSKVRVRPEPGQGYDENKNVQFPRAIRVAGRRFVVDGLNVCGNFYRAKGAIKQIGGNVESSF